MASGERLYYGMLVTVAIVLHMVICTVAMMVAVLLEGE